MGRQVREIGDLQKDIADLPAERPDFLVGLLEELLEEAELVHDFQRRGMNGVPAEIAQEIGVLFEDQDGDPGAGEQQPQHHAGRTSAGDAATDRNLADSHRLYSCAQSSSP